MFSVNQAARMALGAALATLVASNAMAADDFKPKKAGDFGVRLRALAVVPDEDSSIDVIGGEAEIEDNYVPELDLSYFVTDNIALELVLATSEHEVTAENTALGNVDLGDVTLLPPSLVVQYHFLPSERVSPYLGAGLNYTHFFDEEAGGGAVQSIDYDSGIGYTLQAGVDIAIQGGWSFNADVKKIFLDTDVKINGGAINADVDIDPWTIGFGIGYRF